jgi:hypothetical protein
MTEQEQKEIAEDYLEWSGGFPPEDDKVLMYVEYAMNSKYKDREAEIQEWLSDNIGNRSFGRERNKYALIYVGCEGPTVLMRFLLGDRELPDEDDEIVEANSMGEACEKARSQGCEVWWNEDPHWPEAAELAHWGPDGHEGYLVIRADLHGSLKHVKNS